MGLLPTPAVTPAVPASCPRLGTRRGIPVFDAALNTLGLQQQWIQLQALYENGAADRQTRSSRSRIRSGRLKACIRRLSKEPSNLARLDVTNATDLLGMLSSLDSKLAQAEYIGYQAQSAVNQARTLYPRIQGVLTAEQQRTLLLQWAAMRRDAAQVAITYAGDPRSPEPHASRNGRRCLGRRRPQKGSPGAASGRCKPRA